jgi:hypothetical protein
MNIDQARRKGNQRLISMFFKRLATNSEMVFFMVLSAIPTNKPLILNGKNG